jgi:hypothetical protein
MMQTHESPQRLVLQPENEVEQTALNRLQGVFPNVVGGPTTYFTLDLDQYADLDHDLWNSAVFDPRRDRHDAGARALVVDRGGTQ